MIDWHSHILPAMDDGSRNLDESIEMLRSLMHQGVDTVIATPHFYANEESVEEFLSRRRESCEQLCANKTDCDIRIVCGAEVRYYPGISRMEELKKLAIEQTNLLLLEMPMARWTESVVHELVELANMRGLKIIMAHIERYFALQNRKTFDMLIENGILMQVNSSFFERIGTRKKAIDLLETGYVHFIGSDCLNTTTRPPKIAPAYDMIRKKLGEDFVFQMVGYGYRVLEHKT